jgi:four helix bundle protein
LPKAARDFLRGFARHVSIARGSVAEVETQLEIAIELGYLQRADVGGLLNECDELSRMLRNMFRLSRTDRLAEGAD